MLGGRVASTNGVPRVIWKRTVKQAPSLTPRYDYVPFLAISRALGNCHVCYKILFLCPIKLTFAFKYNLSLCKI